MSASRQWATTGPSAEERLRYEEALWQQGVRWVAGVDEAGRGCLAGPVVAAAVILPAGVILEGVDDSKVLTPAARESALARIQQSALAWAVGWADVDVIEAINIREASRLAMVRAVEALAIRPEHLIVDFERLPLNIPSWSVTNGDALSQSVAAASIVAKVVRDRLCVHWDRQYPGYGFGQHKGYATRAHVEAIRRLGPSPLHRRSFLRGVWSQGRLWPDEPPVGVG